jgi:hypothetical protein
MSLTRRNTGGFTVMPMVLVCEKMELISKINSKCVCVHNVLTKQCGK